MNAEQARNIAQVGPISPETTHLYNGVKMRIAEAATNQEFKLEEPFGLPARHIPENRRKAVIAFLHNEGYRVTELRYENGDVTVTIEW